MTSPSPDAPPGVDELSFDKAEPSSDSSGASVASVSAGSCGGCQSPLVHEYWASGDQTLCATCAAKVNQRNAGKAGFTGFIKAGALGTVAAAVGCLIYYLVSLSGYEFGLIAIVVGLMVGYAVRIGSGGYGGVLFQLLAMALTYCSIAGTYTPYVVDGLLQNAAEGEHATADANARDDGTVPPETPSAQSAPKANVVHYVVGFFIALTIPFMSGLENFMGLIILAIGLYEAWKINKRVKVELAGPYPIAAPAPPLEPSRSFP